MGEDQGHDVQVSQKVTPTRVYGKKVGASLCWDGEDGVPEEEKAHPAKINTITLAVHYKADGEYVGKRMIELTPGSIGPHVKADNEEKKAALDAEYAAAVEAAEAQVPPLTHEDDGYPDPVEFDADDPEEIFMLAADAVGGGMSAAQLVTLMATSEQHKGWGRRLLNAAWDNVR